MKHLQLESLLSTRLKRRNLLMGTTAITGIAIASQWLRRVVAAPRFTDYPFSLGVASGDPRSNSVVLWTRLAPEPLTGGGMIPNDVPIEWQVATDPNMGQIVQRGTAIATPEFAHSVRVVVQGLQPATWYWYQFKAGSEVSRIGRTKTAPAPGDRVEQFRFAFVSCQNYEQGVYAAYRDIANQELDLVVHLGDYIYEGAAGQDGPVRQHNGPEITSLADYRNRHALYKLDPQLQDVHAAFPWIFTWDDHEVENNYADEIPEANQSRTAFLQRRANAYQAYYEHMPLRPEARPQGPNMLLYRRFGFGNLIDFSVLDTRQYRTDQPCGDNVQPFCADALSPQATMTGSRQEQWLYRNLQRSRAQWNVIAQQTMFAQYNFDPRPETPAIFNMDQWDGYMAARDRILRFIEQRRPSNPVVITGDIHSSWVHDIKANFNNPDSETLSTEFVGTSVSSDFPAPFIAPVTAALPDNPHTRFFDGAYRGYVLCTITSAQWRSDFRRVVTAAPATPVLDVNTPVDTLASFVVEDGRPGAERA